MQIRVDRSGHVPIYDQIRDQVLGLIHAGQLKAGDQLPTLRALAVELGVNLNTVAHAYHALEAQGVISTRRGEGTFVTGVRDEAAAQRQRTEKLRSLVRTLLDEAQRLGYDADELRAALVDEGLPLAKEKKDE